MRSDLKQFRERAFARTGVREAYDALEVGSSLLARILSAIAEAGLT
jgi:hypothetical protein